MILSPESNGYRDWMTSRKVTASELRAGHVPRDLTGVEWPDGKIECRARVAHVDGSLAAAGETVGVVLTDPAVTCDHCSEACG